MKRGVTYKYDVYDGEEYVGTYTAREIAELTGISKKLVSEYANAFLVYKNRWRFELSSEDFFDWKQEWDSARKKILRSYGRAV